jgi:AcrR family transcriptional regulator
VKAVPTVEPPFVSRDPAERLLRALAATVAARGYSETTVAEIVERASMSQSTFYVHFDSKEEAVLAALDSSGAQLLAATMPAARRAGSCPAAVHTAFSSMFGFLAAEPAFAALRAVAVYAAGPEALEMRDRAGIELLAALFSPGFEGAAETDPLIVEAICAAIYDLLFWQMEKSGAQSLPEIVPVATYISLAPFLGAAKACEVANADMGRRRG